MSDQDGGIRIRHWPIVGMFQPDGIATFQQGGEDFLVTANEGDPRDYATYTEAVQIGALQEQGIPLDHHNPARSSGQQSRSISTRKYPGRLEIETAMETSISSHVLERGLFLFGSDTQANSYRSSTVATNSSKLVAR